MYLAPNKIPTNFDCTSGGKEHFEVLDGLRGTAAFLIVIYHLLNYSFGFHGPWALVHHAYLAVDFFFALSGFVVAYAYDERWDRMTTLQFFRIRLIRLHPLVVLGATFGLLGYIFDPFGKDINHTAAPMLLLAYVISLLLLPTPPVGGRPNDTQALNGPAWSLMQEYLGNIAYALILRRLRTSTLQIIFGLAALLLIWTANAKGTLDGGWDYTELWNAPLRLMVSFVMGLWLYRIHDGVRLPRIGLLPLSVVLIACFQMPEFNRFGLYSLNALYDTGCVLFLFPLIILSGAHSHAGAGMISLCKFSGRISYPLYVTHIAFVYVMANYVRTHHPGTNVILAEIFVVLPLLILVAWLALKFYDEPIRAWLTSRFGLNRLKRSRELGSSKSKV